MSEKHLSVADLDAMPIGSMVMTANWWSVWTKWIDGGWRCEDAEDAGDWPPDVAGLTVGQMVHLEGPITDLPAAAVVSDAETPAAKP